MIKTAKSTSADQHLFDHCANQHLSDHDANIIQLSKVTLMHNTFVYMYLHSYKINILIDNSEYTEYQRKPSC